MQEKDEREFQGMRIAASLPGTAGRRRPGTTRYYLTDQVDSVKVVANDMGAPVKVFEYLPYGESFIEAGEEKHSPKYNSQELDKESSFYFYNARHYDPEITRFVTADTVVDGSDAYGAWNRYMYVHGNPIRYKDPTGHEGVGQDLNESLKKWGDRYEHLNDYEKKIYAADKDGGKKAFNAGALAKIITADLVKNGKFEKNSRHNGQADAFRHALASAILTKQLGGDTKRALKILNAHEYEMDKKDGKWRPGKNIENEMDRRNNKVGANVGKNTKLTIEELVSKIYNKTIKGDLYIVAPKKKRENAVNNQYKQVMQNEKNIGNMVSKAAEFLKNDYRKELYSGNEIGGTSYNQYEIVKSNQYTYKSDREIINHLYNLGWSK